MNQGDCYDLRKVDDEDEFIETKAALTVRANILSPHVLTVCRACVISGCRCHHARTALLTN